MARQPLNKVIHPGRAASIIARAGSQLHGATVAAREARLQTLTPGDQKEAGVLGKVEQTEDEVEGGGGGISFLFLPPTTPLFFLPLASPLFRLPRPLHRAWLFSTNLSLSLSFYPSLPSFILALFSLALPLRTTGSEVHARSVLRYHQSMALYSFRGTMEPLSSARRWTDTRLYFTVPPQTRRGTAVTRLSRYSATHPVSLGTLMIVTSPQGRAEQVETARLVNLPVA